MLKSTTAPPHLAIVSDGLTNSRRSLNMIGRNTATETIDSKTATERTEFVWRSRR
jgi:hypothetical protein